MTMIPSLFPKGRLAQPFTPRIDDRHRQNDPGSFHDQPCTGNQFNLAPL